MSATPPDELTPRRRRILRRVIEEHIATGQPVGSRALATSGEFEHSPSTLRYELAWLERAGLLDHPHTSAGRVPTDDGYRRYAEELIAERLPAAPLPIELATARQELDAVLRATTEALSQVTNLLALVSAPPLSTTVIRHVEVLVLQPQIVMVVIITASGGVAKRVFVFDEPVDQGLAEWAGQYLNETVTGKALGTHALRRHFETGGLGPREQAFLRVIQPLFSTLVESEADRLYIGGASRLISELGNRDVGEIGRLAAMLEERRSMLRLVRDALGSDRVLVRVGEDLDDPAFRPLALVATSYGLAARTLGAVSLLGPTRMDYAQAIASVRGAAAALSGFVEDVYG
jgi:heat-inducible transcriptional repressor